MEQLQDLKYLSNFYNELNMKVDTMAKIQKDMKTKLSDESSSFGGTRLVAHQVKNGADAHAIADELLHDQKQDLVKHLVSLIYLPPGTLNFFGTDTKLRRASLSSSTSFLPRRSKGQRTTYGTLQNIHGVPCQITSTTPRTQWRLLQVVRMASVPANHPMQPIPPVGCIHAAAGAGPDVFVDIATIA